MSFISITKNTGNARFELCVDDLYIRDRQGCIDFGIFKVLTVPLEDGETEEVYVFKDPIPVPDFKRFYASSIKQATDPYLVEVLTRVLYLNPEPDKLMQKRIVEGVLSRFVRKTEVESEVLSGTKLIPCLTYEQVNTVLQTVLLTDYRSYEPNTDRNVLFIRDSKIPKNVKISISLQSRTSGVKSAAAVLIHQVAQYLDEVEDFIHITGTRISEESIKLTPRQVNKYTAQKTKDFIEEANRTRFFKTYKSAGKFAKYLELRESGLNKKDTCKQLGISNTTKLEFARIEEIINSNI